MKPSDISENQLQNVHKLVFLANEYPERKVIELSQLFNLSAMDLNVALWQAQDLGYMFVDHQTGFYKVEMVPEKWDFGPEIADLADAILYAFKKLAEKEADLEDNEIGQWLAGRPSHDGAIATKLLLSEKKLVTYEVTTTNEAPLGKKAKGRGKKPETFESTYTFYTLPENVEQQWGLKQFPDQEKLK